MLTNKAVGQGGGGCNRYDINAVNFFLFEYFPYYNNCLQSGQIALLANKNTCTINNEITDVSNSDHVVYALLQTNQNPGRGGGGKEIKAQKNAFISVGLSSPIF